MRRTSGIVLSLLIWSCVAGGANGTRPTSEVRVVPLTRVVEIPVTLVNLEQAAELSEANPASLLIWPGAEDERPEGPNGFDVLDDGSLLISDPLRKSISVFDAQGKFRGAWKIGFAADSVTVVGGDLVLAREAVTGQYHAFDREGKSRPTTDATLPTPAKASIDAGGKSGSVELPAIQGKSVNSLQVRFDRPDATLLSLQSLASDQDGNTYVALETTLGGQSSDAIDLQKYVRKYSADGHLVCETANIPLDYYVVPTDELRVHKGVVYQLMTTKTEVRINVWDMNVSILASK